MRIKENKITNRNKGLLLIGIALTGILVFIMLNLVSAHENFNETKQLIDSGISCDNLTDEQLEEMGDYYMEQMHPGESHELMHQMMGGENSELTKEMHINMAKSIYCGENTGMMGMMGGVMMSSGMMGGKYSNMMNSDCNINYFNFFGFLIQLLIILILILLIILLIKKIQRKK